MALTFGANTSDRVLVTAGTSIDNQTAFSILSWIYPTTLTRNRRAWSRAAPSAGWEVTEKQGAIPNADAFEFIVARATTSAEAEGAAGTLTVNAWQCFLLTYDETNCCQIYRGTLTAMLAEISYGTLTTGSGATAEQTADLAIGNINGVSPTTAFQGRMAHFQLIARRLTLAEGQALQFRPRVVADTKVFLSLGYAGTDTQPDWSGTGNSGTVTGATVGAHVPIPFRRSGPLYVPYTVAAGTILPQMMQHHHAA